MIRFLASLGGAVISYLVFNKVEVFLIIFFYLTELILQC